MTADPTSFIKSHPRAILAALLQWGRGRHGLSLNDVARRVGVAVAEVEAFERGHAIPSSDVFRRYGASVDKSLRHRGPEYQRAKESEPLPPPIPESEMITNAGRIATNLGDKLATARIVAAADVPPPPRPPDPVPEPASAEPASAALPHAVDNMAAGRATQAETRATYAYQTAEARSERQAAALMMLRDNPKLPATAIIRAVKAKFQGIGLSANVIERLRGEVKGRLDRAERRQTREASPAPTDSKAAEDVAGPTNAATAPDVNAELATVVQLALDAIPNLARLAIVVDAAGLATVEYATRETRVVEQTGSIAVKRNKP